MFIEKTFKKSGFEYTFKACHHKKLPYTVVYIKIDTSEKELLHSLTHKYKMAKLIEAGINTNNFMHETICGKNGIVLYCPENKITNNVSNYIKYLSTETLNPKQFFGKHGSYSKLLSSLKKVTVYVTGKCKTFIKNCMLKDSVPKMDKTMETIATKTDKDRADIKNDKFDENQFRCIELDCSEENALDVMVIFGTKCVDVTKKGSKYQFIYDDCDIKEYKNYVGVLRGLLKFFRGQAGAVGSPAANDQGQKKYKEKCKEIMNSVNSVAFCISDVRGCACSYKSPESLKTVDSNSVKCITSLF